MTSPEPPATGRTILVVSLSPDVGGAERSVLALMSHLEPHGWRPVLACFEGPMARRARALGVRVLAVKWRAIRPISTAVTAGGGKRYPPPLALSAVGASARNLVLLARLIRQEGAVLVVSNSSAAHLFVTATGLLARRPVVWHLRDIVRPGPGRRLLQLAAKVTARVIATSEVVADTMPRSRVVVVDNPVVLRDPRPAPRRDNPSVTVGFLGRLDPEKGVDTLVQAMSAVPAPLLVFGHRGFGPPEYVERLEAMVAASSARIEFRGWVEEPEDAFPMIDVLAVPSVLEPWGRVAAEALMSGIPVVASSTGGLRQIVRDGVDGLLVPPGDVTAWGDALRRLVTDDQLRARMAHSANERPRFRAEVHAQEVAQVLDAALSRGSAGSRGRRAARGRPSGGRRC